LREKFDILFLVQRLLHPYKHECAAGKWTDEELSNVFDLHYHPFVKFTNGALEFIEGKFPKQCSLQILLGYRIIGRMGRLPYAEIRLGVMEPNEDFLRLDCNAEIPVMATRKIYDVLKGERVHLTVATSGFWRFKRLQLRPDLSWLLYKQEKREREVRRFF
jgi:hypothetical protein